MSQDAIHAAEAIQTRELVLGGFVAFSAPSNTHQASQGLI